MSTIYQYLRMLIQLSETDLDKFNVFLCSDYCNTNENARKLLAYLLSYLPNQTLTKDFLQEDPNILNNYPFLQKENLFQAVFLRASGRRYANLDTLMTNSKALLEKFFQFEAFLKDEEKQKIYLLRELKKRGLDSFFERKTNEFGTEFSKKQVVSINQLKYQFSSAEIDYAYLISRDKRDAETHQGFLNVLKGMNQLVATLYLKYTAEVLNRAEMFNEEARQNHPLYLLEHVLWLIGRRKDFYTVPVICLYYHLVKCLLIADKIQQKQLNGQNCDILQRKEKAYYHQLKEELTKQIKANNTEKIDIINVYSATSNYLIRKVNTNPDIIEEVLEWKYLAIDNQLFNVDYGHYLDIVKKSLVAISHYYSVQNNGKMVATEQKLAAFETTYRPKILSNQQLLDRIVDGLKLAYMTQTCANYTQKCDDAYFKFLFENRPSVLSDMARRVLLAQLSYRANNFIALSECINAALFALTNTNKLSQKRKAMNREFFNCMRNLGRIASSTSTLEKKRICVRLGQRLNNPTATQILPVEREWLINELKKVCNCQII